MAKYIPSPHDWVRNQVELYESSGAPGYHAARYRPSRLAHHDHKGHKTGAIRKTPLMRVKDGHSYVLVGSQGGAPKDPAWVHNLRADPHIELRDENVVRPMHVWEVKDATEKARLWGLAVAAYPPYADYQAKTNVRFRSLSPSLNLGRRTPGSLVRESVHRPGFFARQKGVRKHLPRRQFRAPAFSSR